MGTRPVVASPAASDDLKKRNPGTFEKAAQGPSFSATRAHRCPLCSARWRAPHRSRRSKMTRRTSRWRWGLPGRACPAPGAYALVEAEEPHGNGQRRRLRRIMGVGAIPLRKNVALGTAPTGIADSLGIASMAPARLFLESLPPIGRAISAGTGFLDTVPTVRVWAPSVDEAPTTPLLRGRRRRRRPEQHRRAVFAPARP